MRRTIKKGPHFQDLQDEKVCNPNTLIIVVATIVATLTVVVIGGLMYYSTPSGQPKINKSDEIKQKYGHIIDKIQANYKKNQIEANEDVFDIPPPNLQISNPNIVNAITDNINNINTNSNTNNNNNENTNNDIISNLNNDDKSAYMKSVESMLYGLSDGIQLSMKNTGLLKKQNKKYKMLFIGGIEGTGHHLWYDITTAMDKVSDLVDAHHYEDVPLPLCLHVCWVHNQWGTQIERPNAARNFQKWQKNGESGCDCVYRELASFQNDNILHNNSLFHMRSYSYPFLELKLPYLPNLIDLTYIAQSEKHFQYIFDLKIIIMKRDWIECIVSACVHRFGDCRNRIQFLPRALSVLQSQILGIDPNFWILIDYDDMVIRPTQYIPIFSKFLELDEKLVEKGFSVIHASKTTVKKSAWDEIGKQSSSLVVGLKTAFYKEYAKYQWPVFNSDYFLVTPENTAFLDSKFEN